MTTSKDFCSSVASTVGGDCRVTLPAGLAIVSPVAASRSARAGRTRNVTSRPASSSRPPKYPPVAPAPTTRKRMAQLLIVTADQELVVFEGHGGLPRRAALGLTRAA